MTDIRIGTSGWDYGHWRNSFYPPGERPNICRYSEHFDTVEINHSFYRLPSAQTFEKWRGQTPADFLFAVKASRFITHMKKLKDPAGSFEKFFAAVAHLGTKLGPVLFQFPPRWGCNLQRLSEFLDVVHPKRLRCAFEFRNETWFQPAVVDLLTRHNAAFCIYDIAQRRSPLSATADFVYIRLHGPGAAGYSGSYSDDALNQWATRIRSWQSSRRDVFFYFDNDQKAYAAGDAIRLKTLLGRPTVHRRQAQR